MTSNQPDGWTASNAAATLSDPNASIAAALEQYRQGDAIVNLTTIAVTADNGDIVSYPSPNGVVLVSQTCDIVQTNRQAVAVAPLLDIENATVAAEARGGKRPSLVHLPELGSGSFANLEVVGTVSKHLLVRHSPSHGVATESDIRKFAQAIGRKWSRFAFPDDIVPWLAPLEKILRSKALKPATPEGSALESVVELRVEAQPGWMSPGPQELTIAIIVAPGAMPSFGPYPPEIPDDLAAWLYDEEQNLVRDAPTVAGRLFASTNPIEHYFLWGALGQAWAARCVPTGNQPKSVHDAVASIVAEVVGEDEYTLDRVHCSEQLDLDHLSTPLPRAPRPRRTG